MENRALASLSTGYDDQSAGSTKPRTFSYTIVICVRLHEHNPWVLDRLDLLQGDGAIAPPVVVVDFGSAEPYATAIGERCAELGLRYLFVNDDGVFSLSRARNIGFRAARTPYVLFSDIDFVFRSDAFDRLETLIGTLGLDHKIDQIVNLPAFHLSEEATERWTSSDDRDGLLDRATFDVTFNRFGRDFEFIAPYSNVFLINSKFFEIVGGYDETFRGHGSEDFEFLTRAAIHTRFYRMPRRVDEDRYSPARSDFFEPKDYLGYRRLLEVICLPSELLGLKTFHLYHPRAVGDAWRQNNDWKRTRLKANFDIYLSDWRKLLSVDFLPREKIAVCVCKAESHDGYFYPLRLAGYRTYPLFEATEDEIKTVEQMLDSGEVGAFAVFNPYMISHRQFKPLFDKARARGVKTIVVERGALPNSVYYSDDVCYVDPSYSEQSFLAETFSDSELAHARAYIERLRGGENTLERAAGYRETQERIAQKILETIDRDGAGAAKPETTPALQEPRPDVEPVAPDTVAPEPVADDAAPDAVAVDPEEAAARGEDGEPVAHGAPPEEAGHIDINVAAETNAPAPTEQARSSVFDRTDRPRIVFVPLQLPEDMAVTMFVREAQVYADFAGSLAEVVEANPNVLFVVKAHPLSSTSVLPQAPNAVLAEQKDNIHCLIDLADAVVCYNSGVGLLSLLHEKPLVTVGNAFYNVGGAGRSAQSLAEAVDIAVKGFAPPPPALVERICAWFVSRKYSAFVADDDIKTTPTRSIHSYKNILVTTLRLGDETHDIGRMRQFGRFERQSYGAARINVNAAAPGSAKPSKADLDAAMSAQYGNVSRGRAMLLLALQTFVTTFYPERFRLKILRSPRAFIRDSKNPVIKMTGRLIFGKQI